MINIKRIIAIGTFLLILVSAFFFSSNKQQSDQQVVGIIVPMEHEALKQIIQGLEEEILLETDKNISIKVLNAQGDLNIQHALIEKLIRDQCDLIIPIGTAASQMTLNLVKDQDILCLAADTALISSEAKKRATVLDDELAVSDSLSFIKVTFPLIKKITLLYSPSEKVAKEIPRVVEAAYLKGLEVQYLMAHSLSELYTISQRVAPDSGAIFILKDHLIVSGIQTVIQQAEKRAIPVITSDEGSVISGAAFAIGIKEANIGRQGAKIVKSILSGTSPQEIPPTTINGPFPIFINKKACMRQGVDPEVLIRSAQEKEIPVHFVQSTGEG